METLQFRGSTIALVLTLSGCAGKLDNAGDYYGTTAPVSESDTNTSQAGRSAASAGRSGSGGQLANAGGRAAGGNKAAGGSGGSANPASSNDDDDQDAGAGPVDAGSTPMPMACDFRALMEAKCGNASCHGAPGSATGLDLTSPMLGARVADRNGKGACSDKLLVDPDNPRDSKLYLKVSGSSCGTQMPVGGSLDQEEQACVLTWIENL